MLTGDPPFRTARCQPESPTAAGDLKRELVGACPRGRCRRATRSRAGLRCRAHQLLGRSNLAFDEGHRGARSTSTGPGWRSPSSWRRPAVASASAHRSRPARGARSRSTQRPSTHCAATATPSGSSATSPSMPTGTATWSSPTSLGTRSIRSGSPSGSGSTRKAAGIPTGTLHVLRHTAATLALTNGVPVHIVAARLGDTPATLLSTYSHLLPQSDEIAAERVAAALTAGERDEQPAQPNPPRPDSAVGGWAGSPNSS
jgi:integrase